MFGYETSDRRRHSRDSIRKRLRIEWRFFVFLRGIFRLFKLEARNIELEFMEWKLDQFQRYRWFLSMEFVIRRWIFVWKGGLGIVQFGNGIGSLAFLLVMENTYILFLSHSFQLWTFRGIFKHFKPPLYFSFFLFFFFPIYHPWVFSPLLRKLWGLYYEEDSKIFFHTSTLFFFFQQISFVSSRLFPSIIANPIIEAVVAITRCVFTTREAYHSCGYKDCAESSIKSNQWALCGRPIWLLIHLSLLEARPSCQTSHLSNDFTFIHHP